MMRKLFTTYSVLGFKVDKSKKQDGFFLTMIEDDWYLHLWYQVKVPGFQQLGLQNW